MSAATPPGPAARALVLLLRAYRALISPLYGPTCRYYPSCSAYALEAVRLHGAWRGSVLAVRRLARCHPWTAGGVDHVPGHRDARADAPDPTRPVPVPAPAPAPVPERTRA